MVRLDFRNCFLFILLSFSMRVQFFNIVCQAENLRVIKIGILFTTWRWNVAFLFVTLSGVDEVILAWVLKCVKHFFQKTFQIFSSSLSGADMVILIQVLDFGKHFFSFFEKKSDSD